jgi:hypothetical protein
VKLERASKFPKPRGTLLFASRSGGVFGVFVARGAAAVAGDVQTISLRFGEATDIAKPDAPPSAPKSWAGEHITRAIGSADGFPLPERVSSQAVNR